MEVEYMKKAVKILLSVICVICLCKIQAYAQDVEDIESIRKLISSSSVEMFDELTDGAEYVYVLNESESTNTMALDSESNQYMAIGILKTVNTDQNDTSVLESSLIVLSETAYSGYWQQQSGIYDIAFTYQAYVTQYLEDGWLPTKLRADLSKITVVDNGSDPRTISKIISEIRFEEAQGMNVIYRGSHTVNYPSSGVLYQKTLNSAIYGYPQAIVLLTEIYLSDGTMHQFTKYASELK